MSLTLLRRAAVATTAAAMALAAAVALPPPTARAATETVVASTADTPWRYLDDTTDPAPGNAPDAWTLPGFDDTAWKSANGSFGALNGQLGTLSGGYRPATLLRQYSSGTTNIPAFFFRSTVSITAEQLSAAHSAKATILYDDAASLFVNGTYVGGGHDAALQADPARNITYGGSNASAPSRTQVSIPLDLLKAGENVVAVRLHNGRASSSDLYLDVTSITLSNVAPDPTSNVVLGVGRTALERTLVWYSASAEGQLAILAKSADVVGGTFPADAPDIQPTASGLSLDSGKTWNHTRFENLEPGTSYSYIVGSPAGGWSPVYEFSTAAADAGEYLFIGDAQIGSSGNPTRDSEGWNNTLEIARGMFPTAELLVSAGDQVNTASSEVEYAGFTAPDALKELALSPTIGNHDVGSVAAYQQHFNLPSYDASGTRNHWFGWNKTLFLVINTNLRNTAAHQAWLESAIAEAGDGYDHRVVVMHHSIYSTASHANDGDIIARRAELPAVFSALGIDLVLAGHDHVYTRTHLMKDGTPVTDGQPAVVTPKQGEVMYVTANSASGSKFYNILNQPFPYLSVQNQERIPNFTHVVGSECEVSVTTYRSGDKSVVDGFTLKTLGSAPTITVPSATRLGVSDVEGFDPQAGVTVTDPCEQGLTATVSGEVKPVPGDHTLTYSATDAHGNTVETSRTVTVVATETTVTATATATATSTVTAPGATSTVTAPPATSTVTAPGGTTTVTPKPSAPSGSLYETPGFHSVNGRSWMTTCEPYGSTTRCWTWIWASQIHRVGGQFVQVDGWAFNNLSYLPMARSAWGSNPLARTGAWTASDGRHWRTECDTAVTGRNGCRSWVKATVHQGVGGSFRTVNTWVLNNMVRFS